LASNLADVLAKAPLCSIEMGSVGDAPFEDAPIGNALKAMADALLRTQLSKK
jgi:hypothetical protein